jgi:hypothetical protein
LGEYLTALRANQINQKNCGTSLAQDVSKKEEEEMEDDYLCENKKGE